MTSLTIALLALLLTLQLADWWTTRTILGRGGQEYNPVIRWAIGMVGVDGALALKAALVLALAWWSAGYTIWALVGLCVVYVAVVAFNLKSIL